MQTLVLENSTNTHVLETKGQIVETKNYENGIMSIKTDTPEAYVTHGEHGTLGLESKKTFKYIQQEFNPVTKAIMNALD